MFLSLSRRAEREQLAIVTFHNSDLANQVCEHAKRALAGGLQAGEACVRSLLTAEFEGGEPSMFGILYAVDGDVTVSEGTEWRHELRRVVGRIG